jgi:hypothetical protein
MRQWFFNILVGLLKKVLNTNILLASVKTFKNSETCTESRIRIIPRLTISVIGQFWSKFYSNRRFFVCRNKLFEEGYWKDF